MVRFIGVYARLVISGASFLETVTEPIAQSNAVLFLYKCYAARLMLTAVNLIVEVEILGYYVGMLDDEIPTVVTGVLSPANWWAFTTHCPGDICTVVYLESAHSLSNQVKSGSSMEITISVPPWHHH